MNLDNGDRLTQNVDEDIVKSWRWFLSFMSERDWVSRKALIEQKITVHFSQHPTITVMVVKEDLIGWYLYLIDVLINEPQKYEYFQGARVLPIFKRFGMDLDTLKSIVGIEKRIRDLLRKRPSEADAFLFEMLIALVWARNGYEVEFIPEKSGKKSPDLLARKNGKSFDIECKRQSKTSDYTYRETAKRIKMLSYIRDSLLERNILMDVTFHVELESLPDTYLKDLLSPFFKNAESGATITNKEVDIHISYIDIAMIKQHMENYDVKYNSPMMLSLIGDKPVYNKSFSWGLGQPTFFKVGDSEINNLYVSDIGNAFGVYWTCDAKEAVMAKARDIKNQVYAAMQQFNSDHPAVIHVGMETFDGPEVERARFEKIKNTVEMLNPDKTPVKWIFCHFFHAYSPPDQNFIFDETVSALTAGSELPLQSRLLIVPDDGDNAENISHWERPLPK